MGAWVIGVRRLDGLLLAAWPLLLIQVVTGSYNMEYSAGIPMTPSLLNLNEVSRVPLGLTYTFALSSKLGIYTLVLLHTLAVTILYLRGRVPAPRLRRAYLVGATVLALVLTGLTAVVLLLHEAADLYPTALHGFGGRLGPQPPALVGRPGGQVASDGFPLLGQGPTLVAIVLRWLHLLGFGLWLGLTGLGLTARPLPTRRLLLWSWIALGVQGLSGAGHLFTWVPLTPLPLPFNLEALRRLRFGLAYMWLLLAKLAVGAAVLGVTAALSSWATRRGPLADGKGPNGLPRRLLGLNLALGLLLAYLAVMLLLVHEGIDHVL
ncbi:MAG: hypothetical protein HYY85_22115 [Deltaproteobacteria bacterium]|nr:hypothetical protein [Deltaproteobacteria bacterium]